MTRKSRNKPPAIVSDESPSVAAEQHVSFAEMHVGPLPSARDLVLINQNIPGAVDRIIAFAEREQERRENRDEILLKTNEQDRASNRLCAERSQLLGFGFAILYMAFLFCLAFLGMENALKYAIVSGMVVGLPAVIYSFLPTHKRKTDNNNGQRS